MIKLKSILFSILLLVSLAGCGTREIVMNEVKDTPFHPPLPSPYTGMTFEKDTWVVLTPEVMTQILEDIKEGKSPPVVFFGLESQDYLTFSQSTEDLVNYVGRQKNLICYYRRDLQEPFCKKSQN